MSKGLLVAAILAVTFGGGLARLALESGGSSVISDPLAAKLAECLPQHQIAKDSTIRLAALGQPAQGQTQLVPAPTMSLRFSLTDDQPLDLVDAGDVAALQRMSGPATLREGTVARIKAALFTVQDASVAVREGDSTWLLRANEPLRFAQSVDTEYFVKLAAVAVDAADSNGGRRLKKGTQGELMLPNVQRSGGVSLVPLQGLVVQPWLTGASRNISPTRTSGQKGFSDLAVEVRKAGIPFDAAGTSFAGCAWRGGEQPLPAGVPVVKPAGAGLATITVMAPAEVIPAFPSPRRAADLVRLVVATSDGRYVGFGAFAALARGWAAVAAALWLLVCVWMLLTQRQIQLLGSKSKEWKIWSSGLFLGPDRQPSLALFQIFFWTMITVWGLAYVFLVTGSLASLTPSMMALIGIAGTGTVAARYVSRPDVANAATPATNTDFSALLSTNGQFDLLKLQLLLFTLMIGLYVLWRLLDTGVFPELDSGTLLLLGVSQGIYVGGKVAATTPIATVQALKLDLETKRAAVANLAVEKANLQGKAARTPDEEKRLGEIGKQEADVSTLEAKYKAALKELGLDV